MKLTRYQIESLITGLNNFGVKTIEDADAITELTEALGTETNVIVKFLAELRAKYSYHNNQEKLIPSKLPEYNAEEKPFMEQEVDVPGISDDLAGRIAEIWKASAQTANGGAGYISLRSVENFSKIYKILSKKNA